MSGEAGGPRPYLLLEIACAECDTGPGSLVTLVGEFATIAAAQARAEEYGRAGGWEPHPLGGIFRARGDGEDLVIGPCIWPVVEPRMAPRADAEQTYFDVMRSITSDAETLRAVDAAEAAFDRERRS